MMKRLFVLSSMIVILLIASCNGQPKTSYEIYSNSVTGATNYIFFLEKKSANPYKLIQGADYLSPDITSLQVGVSTTPSFTVNLTNDGSEYTVGIVAVNGAGYYSGLGVATGTVGLVPTTPAGVGFRKK